MASLLVGKVEAFPTTTLPSHETANACVNLRLLPGNAPRPTMPSAAVQRKASASDVLMLRPTTTEPSADTAVAPDR
jgi:hypothetical protein